MGRNAAEIVGLFTRETRGSVAIIFAAVLIPVLGITSAAIDFGRAAKVRSTLQTATSAAAQSASARLLEDDSVIEQDVKRMMSANLPAELKGLPYKVKIGPERAFVEVAMEATVPTTLMGMMGVSELPVEATGHARAPVAVAKATEAGLKGGDSSIARDALVRGLGRAGPGGAAGAHSAAIAEIGKIQSEEDLKAAAQAVAEKVRELSSQLGGGAGANIGAADVERLMRELRRSAR